MPQVEIGIIVMKDAVNVLIVQPKLGPDAGKWSIPIDYVRDGEKLIEAADRVIKEQTGLSTIPKRILFPVELVEDGRHHIVMVGYSECGSSGDPKPNFELINEAKFVDPRSLGDYQNSEAGMSIIAARSFANFSAILMQQAKIQAAAAPTSGTI